MLQLDLLPSLVREPAATSRQSGWVSEPHGLLHLCPISEGPERRVDVVCPVTPCAAREPILEEPPNGGHRLQTLTGHLRTGPAPLGLGVPPNEAHEAVDPAPVWRRDLGSTPNPFGASANWVSYDGDRYSENLQPSVGM